jgi:hypothetical protein
MGLKRVVEVRVGEYNKGRVRSMVGRERNGYSA